MMYEYKANVCSVYDADTIRVDIDLGCGVWLRNEPLRLFGINAPELRGPERPEGLASRDFMRGLLPAGREIVIRTVKDKKGKFGRYLATVLRDGENLNDLLVAEGYAEAREY